MKKLDDKTIKSLALFFRFTVDERRQAIVDQLGTHPYNHARFVDGLWTYGHAESRLMYFNLIDSI